MFDTWIIPGAMALVVLGFALLIRVGGQRMRGDAVARVIGQRNWPRATIIVPVAGAVPGLAENLSSFLSQDYPEYRLVVATRDHYDPAVPIIQRIIAPHSNAARVCGGQAVHCGQKNQNILAGLHEAGEYPEIYVFCDSTRLASADLLKRLIEPIVLKRAEVASGYHHIIPGDGKIATLGHAAVVLLLYLAKNIPAFSQPWGGCTAIRRSLFESLRVAELWRENVFDDVSLAALLHRHGKKVAPVPEAWLGTPLENESFSSWAHWFVRQIIGLKFSFPLLWFALGGLLALVSLLVLFALVQVVLLPFTGMTLTVKAGIFFLAAGLGLLAGMRHLHPATPPVFTWLAAFLTAYVMANWCYLRTLFTMEVDWHGIRYRVDRQGRVLGMDLNP